MKILFIIMLCVAVKLSYSQPPKPLAADTCKTKGRLLPCRINTRTRGIMTIDTISAATFKSIISSLHAKLKNNQVLNKEEDRKLILVLNTASWADVDEQKGITATRFPLLNSLNDLYYDQYSQKMRCKYTVCFGSGTGAYFVELGVQYIGNPYACDRYYIKD